MLPLSLATSLGLGPLEKALELAMVDISFPACSVIGQRGGGFVRFPAAVIIAGFFSEPAWQFN
jgi:hypothetical protein